LSEFCIQIFNFAFGRTNLKPKLLVFQGVTHFFYLQGYECQFTVTCTDCKQSVTEFTLCRIEITLSYLRKSMFVMNKNKNMLEKNNSKNGRNNAEVTLKTD